MGLPTSVQRDKNDEIFIIFQYDVDELVAVCQDCKSVGKWLVDNAGSGNSYYCEVHEVLKE